MTGCLPSLSLPIVTQLIHLLCLPIRSTEKRYRIVVTNIPVLLLWFRIPFSCTLSFGFPEGLCNNNIHSQLAYLCAAHKQMLYIGQRIHLGERESRIHEGSRLWTASRRTQLNCIT